MCRSNVWRMPFTCARAQYPGVFSSAPALLVKRQISAQAPHHRVCGMVILHRHGERAPVVNFYDNGSDAAVAQEEQKRWLRRLPNEEDMVFLNSHFPIQSAASRIPRDVITRPFGCLTGKGLESMRNLGRSIRTLHPELLGGGEFKEHSDTPRRSESVKFKVFSSNFSRTQQSAQGLLHGLGAQQVAHSGQVPVFVREENDCTIHMYDNKPAGIQDEVNKVLTSSSFLCRQEEQETLKSDLVKLIPKLTRENFKWMEAADFFWCWPEDADMPPRLQKLRRPTLEYVAWRFKQYYSHRPLLTLVIAPLLEEVLRTLHGMSHAHSERRESKERSLDVNVYSGHDVTLLAFLHALDWPLIHDLSWWPPFCSALVFEVLEPVTPDRQQEHRVRMRLDMVDKSFSLFLPALRSHALNAIIADEDAGIPLSELQEWVDKHCPVGLIMSSTSQSS